MFTECLAEDIEEEPQNEMNERRWIRVRLTMMRATSMSSTSIERDEVIEIEIAKLGPLYESSSLHGFER